MLTIEMLAKKESGDGCEKGSKYWTNCTPHADAKEDFSPNLTDEAQGTQSRLLCWSHTPQRVVGSVVCQSVANL